MKSEQLTALALRVVAVVIAAYACADLANIPAVVPDFQAMDTTAAAPNAYFMFGYLAVVLWSIPMIVAVLLWWLAPRLARLACRRIGSEMNLSGLNVEKLTHGAFIVVGTWILVFGIIYLAGTGVRQLEVVIDPGKWGAPSFPWGSFTEYVLRCLFGFVLIIGGRPLSRMLLRLRTAGTE